MSQPPEPLFDIAHGDQGASRHLRRSFEAIKSAATDPDLRRQIDDVLAGRTSMRAFGNSESFAQVVDRIPRNIIDRDLSMPEEERERLAARGDAELERLRNPPAEPPATPPPPGPAKSTAPRVLPGTRAPNREQIFVPDEPDDDDLYFQQRRQQGWLR
ncbi:hypothetical protein BJY24_005271 [Nocardia transvalensis]|uniref:Uncharacterized protein n=1 Tax=Nocardia transvalensis TaxID=37333 RepID=A0A7W9PHR1_9NOCA|nr:hypothetical protein [Nocardia transvalensis]MBB5916359.1 hypothetical protein [Nocardia transvalensis]